MLQSEDFRAVFSHTRFKVSCRHFLMLAIPNEKGEARLGVVVAKKNIPGAVQRNRVKRLIRENFRRRKEQLSGTDLVVLARKGAHAPGNVAINHRLNALWDDLLKKMRAAGDTDRQESP